MSDITDYEKRFTDYAERESENRAMASEDIAFSRLGQQWPEKVKAQREREGRPCLTINKLPTFIRQVVNDSRQNSPQIKVKPVDDYADPETAEILSGLIRNIEYSSQASNAYDMALESAVTCGMGFFRICTDYSGDDEFTQDIRIKRITNPLSVVFDSYGESIDGSDWKDVFLVDWITKDEYRSRFGKKDAKSFSSDVADGQHVGHDMVRICEHWEVEEKPGTLYLLSDGSVITKAEMDKDHPDFGITVGELLAANGVVVARERKTTTRHVKQRVLGGEILEENDWAGKWLPIVPVFGDEVFHEGKRTLKSLIRDAKDAQQMLNFWRTASTELVALAPKAPFIGPVGAFKTDAKKWANANNRSFPYIEYDGGIPPQRQGFAGPPAGALQEALNASDDMKSIIGIYDASLGARSNETSGKAIMARQREGDVSTFHFIDNLSKSLSHAGRIMIDLIPKIYDTPRIVRTLGLDGSTQAVQVNAPTQHKGVERIFDLKVGKYDVVVETGPSYTTQREEAANQMIELLRAFPQAAPFIGDLLAKNLDWPGADEIAKRLKAMLPPQIQQLESGEGLPPEAMQQINSLNGKLQQMSQAMQQGMGEFQKVVAELESMKADKALESRKLDIDAYAKETDRIKVQVGAGIDIANQIAQAQPIYQDPAQASYQP
ncbi:MAG: portal protein [Burkholderiales bacterium]